MKSDSAAIRRLAARLLQVEQGLRNISTVPQLGRSSLDDEALLILDGDGNVMGRVGRQDDGTYGSTTLDGPTPVAPATPSTSGGPGVLTVEWDGRFADDAVAPLDFHVVEIYVATEPFTTIGDARLMGHFSNESGGEITVARPKGEQYVGLVTKARSGKRSGLSTLATAVVESVVDQDVLDELDDKIAQAEQDLAAAEGRLSTAEGQITDAFGQIDTLGDDVSGAVAAAEAAETSAAQAASDASAAQQVASEAQSTAETARSEAASKSAEAEQAAKAYADAEAEAARLAAIAEASGDASDKAAAAEAAAKAAAAADATEKADAAQAAAEAKAQIAQDTADAAQQRANEAHDTAGNAQDTADLAMTAAGSKTTITYSTSAPAGNGQREGDTHRQRDNSNNIVAEWRWTGSAWQKQEVTSEMISNLDVGKLTAGYGEISEVVAQAIAAASAAFIELDVENLRVTGTSTVNEQVAQAIWTAKLAAQKVLASDIATETLAADSGFIGVLNSATIVGAIIKTASSGARVELDSANGIRIFNQQNQPVFNITAEGSIQMAGSFVYRHPVHGKVDVGLSRYGTVGQIYFPAIRFGDPDTPSNQMDSVPSILGDASGISLQSDKSEIFMGTQTDGPAGPGTVQIVGFDIDGKLVRIVSPDGSMGNIAALRSDIVIVAHRGVNTFLNTTQRNSVLSSAPDGTEAYTGTGNTLTKWVRKSSAWVKVWEDTGWENLSAYYASGFSGAWFEGSIVGREVEISLGVDGSMPVGSTTVTRPLPAKWRPRDNKQAAAWLSGNYEGLAFIRPDGTIAVVNRSPGTRASAQITVKYRV